MRRFKPSQLRGAVTAIDVGNRLGQICHCNGVTEIHALCVCTSAGVRYREHDGLRTGRRRRAGNDARIEREAVGKRSRLLHERVGRRAAAHLRRKRLLKSLSDVCRKRIHRLRKRLRTCGLKREVPLTAQCNCPGITVIKFCSRIRTRPCLHEYSFANSKSPVVSVPAHTYTSSTAGSRSCGHRPTVNSNRSAVAAPVAAADSGRISTAGRFDYAAVDCHLTAIANTSAAGSLVVAADTCTGRTTLRNELASSCSLAVDR